MTSELSDGQVGLEIKDAERYVGKHTATASSHDETLSGGSYVMNGTSAQVVDAKTFLCFLLLLNRRF